MSIRAYLVPRTLSCAAGRICIRHTSNDARMRAFSHSCAFQLRRQSIFERRRSLSNRSEANIKASRLPRTRRLVVRTATILGFTVVIGGVLLGGFFLYDATTYRSNISRTDIEVPTLALNPETGGPKNLPLARVMIDDEDELQNKITHDKPRLVILGSGWGAVTLLKGINPKDYHITVVSPTNYFLFTPLLPAAAVGTMELRTLVEPIRKVTKAVGGHYIEASAEDIEISEKLVELQESSGTGEKRHFYLPYDKLVVAVGAQTNPHGVEGLEHCKFLKSVTDAREIKRTLMSNFERACLPSTSDEERKRLLSFVVCGGGPTGIEFAAELYDMVAEDLYRYFPRILQNEVTVHIIQSRDHILNTYDETISEFAEKRFRNEDIDLFTNSRVKHIHEDRVEFSHKTENGEVVTKEIPFGMCLWSTGNSLTDFSRKICEKLGEAQQNKHAIETDTHLRVIGAPMGSVYAIGDCSTVQNNLASHVVGFLRSINTGDQTDIHKRSLTFQQWRALGSTLRKRFPQASAHLKRLDKLFTQYDKDKSGTLDFDELHSLLETIDSKLTSLPGTAQRASSQGAYLAKKFNKLARINVGFAANDIVDGDLDAAAYKAYAYRHLGNLAYIGNGAVFDFNGHSFFGGLVAMYLWRSIYLSEAVSLRTKVLFILDWFKRGAFGRDLSFL